MVEEEQKKENFHGAMPNVIATDMLNKLTFSNKKRILDVGSADNIFYRLIKNKDQFEYFTLEMPLSEWNENPINMPKHSYYWDLNDPKPLPIKNKEFDIINCLDTLEHTLYPQRVLDEFKRITKDDAIFFLSMPNEYNFLRRIYFLFGKKTDVELPWRVVEEHMHIQQPRVIDILNLMEENFEVLEVKYIWDSRHSEKSKMFQMMDWTIDKLSGILPSLFTRDVIVMAKKKSKERENEHADEVICRYCSRWNPKDRMDKECIYCNKMINKRMQGGYAYKEKKDKESKIKTRSGCPVCKNLNSFDLKTFTCKKCGYSPEKGGIDV